NCVSAQGSRYRGTVVEFPDFNPSSDAEVLYNAMKGFGDDKETILELITSRSNAQRQEICAAYKSQYGKDLIGDLKYELTGKFERLIVGLMRPTAYHDAKEIKDAIEGIGTDEKCLIEILASRNNKQIHDLVNAYKDAYGRDLEADIVSDTSGHFKKMLVVLLQGTREEDDVVSEDLVEQDAQDLFDAGEVQWGTDEAKFITILGNRSVTHLQMVFDKYENIANKEIEDSIRGELSGDFEKLMLAVVQCIRSVPMYFAKQLFKAMKGLGTADNTLIRIMVSRAEIDMLDIREFFRLSYEKSLYNMIKDDTSGEYKRSLLKLCGGDDDLAGEFFPEAAQLAYKMWEVSSMARVELKGTVQPAANFNPDSDAQALRKAMKGFGTDEDTIVDIVTHRSNAQRQEILQKYKSLLGRDLMADLKSELSGSLCRLILGLMMTPAQFDAKMMRKAMEGAGTDEKALIEILTTRNNQEILAMNEAYKEAYHKSLEDSITSDTSGHFCRVLVSLVQGSREEGPADLARAQEDAKVITAGQPELGDAVNDESTSMETKFLSILCTRSYPHLRKVFQEFVTCTNKDVEQVIRKEISGDLKMALIAIVRSIKNKPSYFADRLYKSMKGLGTDDRTLIRVMISRSEIDLFNIRREYKELHDVSLHESIKVEALCGDTSGDYRKALLTLCGGED
ncbi:annexin A6-like isoform X1, partial [Acipenser oxyrinchus oxyrinchus]